MQLCFSSSLQDHASMRYKQHLRRTVSAPCSSLSLWKPNLPAAKPRRAATDPMLMIEPLIFFSNMWFTPSLVTIMGAVRLTAMIRSQRSFSNEPTGSRNAVSQQIRPRKESNWPSSHPIHQSFVLVVNLVEHNTEEPRNRVLRQLA
jgi:hypothetical protein